MILVFLKALPAILSLLSTVMSLAKTMKDQQAGAAEMAIKVLQKATEDIQRAAVVEAQAEKDHLQHPNDDGGFDQEFKV